MKKKMLLSVLACTIMAVSAGCGSREDEQPGKDGTDSPGISGDITAGVDHPESSGSTAQAQGMSTAKEQESLITMDEATAIAWKDAKVGEEDVKDLRVRLERDDGSRIYKIIFTTAKKAYEYKIDASDGLILEKEVGIIESVGNIQAALTPEATPTPAATKIPEATKAPVEVPKATKTPAADTQKATPVPTSKPQANKSITEDKAVEIAGNDAGVAVSNMRNLEVHLDYEDGKKVYDVEFDAGDKEYEYKIVVSDGSILEREIEVADHAHTNAVPVSPKPTGAASKEENTVTTAPAKNPATGEITKEQAVEIARKAAGVSESDIRNLKVHLDFDDGIWEYEIEFDAGDMEYDYDIAVADGTIRKKEADQIDDVQAIGRPGSSTPEQTDGISREEALEIAKKDAGITGDNFWNLVVKYEYDDGIWRYKVEFDADGKEYEYEIAAANGLVLEKDIELMDDVQAIVRPETGGTSQSGEITQDEALEIAAKDAGVARDTMRKLEIERDFDDGIWIYEIEFKSGRLEYEYEIAASNGKILKKEVDD